MRNLLVTGTAGFIGINWIRYLLEDPKKVLSRYDQIYFVDKMGYATTYNQDEYMEIKRNNKNITFYDKNINEISNVLMNKPSWDVVNFASESHVDNSLSKPFDIFQENSMIPVSICKLLGVKNINHFYHISTDEVYSEIPLDKIYDYDNWFSINSPIKPNNPYSASKAAQDCFLMSMNHTFNLNVKFIRMANQMPGKFQHPEKMLMASIIRVLKNENVKIYGDGKNVRQWTPVNITVKIIYDILCEEIIFDNVIHLANKKGLLNNNQIIDILEEVMGDYGYKVKKEYITDRLGHDTAYALQTTSVVDKYFEDCSINDTMRECVEYCIDNKNVLIK